MAAIRFLTNEANKVEGLAYAGFETFRGSPYTSCARETGQNSRDAAAGTEPVKVSFNLRLIDRAAVPFADELQHSISCCLDAPQDEKTKEHLERALKTVSAPVIKVLEIADENTTGLTGPIADPKSVFTALVKGDGVTNKPDATSAGSFGIGKNAAYAVSDLQTVIYSTCYRVAPDDIRFAAQGRLRLISHVDGDKKLSAEGYWGNADFAAIEDRAEAPAWVRRHKVGTSIFSIGFREQEHWATRMTLSLVTNFFLAIDRRQIEFSVGDATQMNQASLDSILGSADLRQVAADTDQLDELDRARRLIDCVRSEAATHHSIKIPGLGEFVLHLLVGEGLPREVHVLRNGIYITDNFAKFGQPMRRFPGTREFTAVLEPATGETGRKPSALLKQLENPAHDAFEPERIIEAQELSRARQQIKALITRVREIIRAVAKIEDINRSQLEELSHLFADGGLNQKDTKEDAEKDPDRFSYGEARKKKRDEPGGVKGKGRGRRRGGQEKGKAKTRTGTGRTTQRPAGVQPAVPLQAIRSVLPDAANPQRRTIFFTPSTTGEIDLSVGAAGLNGEIGLKVSAADAGAVNGGLLRLPVSAGKRVAVDVTFSEPYAGPIELGASKVAPAVQAETA